MHNSWKYLGLKRTQYRTQKHKILILTVAMNWTIKQIWWLYIKSPWTTTELWREIFTSAAVSLYTLERLEDDKGSFTTLNRMKELSQNSICILKEFLSYTCIPIYSVKPSMKAQWATAIQLPLSFSQCAKNKPAQHRHIATRNINCNR